MSNKNVNGQDVQEVQAEQSRSKYMNIEGILIPTLPAELQSITSA